MANAIPLRQTDRDDSFTNSSAQRDVAGRLIWQVGDGSTNSKSDQTANAGRPMIGTPGVVPGQAGGSGGI